MKKTLLIVSLISALVSALSLTVIGIIYVRDIVIFGKTFRDNAKEKFKRNIAKLNDALSQEA